MTYSMCRSCNAVIVWALTRSGQRMPVDREPSPRGNVRLVGDEIVEAEVLTGVPLVLAREKREPLHLSHFATCPDHADWRRYSTRRGHRKEEAR